MITLTIRLKVRSEKHNELVQTLTVLVKEIKKEKGCLQCSFFQDLTDENVLLLDQEWEDRKCMYKHMESNNFKILRGAASYLLSEDPEITMATAPDRAGMKELKI
jgi:quinol monooxygenase YgiN